MTEQEAYQEHIRYTHDTYCRIVIRHASFDAARIYAMLHDYKAMDMINFAVASSAIKHNIHGDANITNDVSSIRNLMNMNYDIKR